jgi:hypothetical protein
MSAGSYAYMTEKTYAVSILIIPEIMRYRPGFVDSYLIACSGQSDIQCAEIGEENITDFGIHHGAAMTGNKTSGECALINESEAKIRHGGTRRTLRRAEEKEEKQLEPT